MTLKEACELADACGLETIGEAIMNAEFHAISLFTYDEIAAELNELYNEADGYDMDTPIEEVLKE